MAPTSNSVDAIVVLLLVYLSSLEALLGLVGSGLVHLISLLVFVHLLDFETLLQLVSSVG